MPKYQRFHIFKVDSGYIVIDNLRGRFATPLSCGMSRARALESAKKMNENHVAGRLPPVRVDEAGYPL